MKDLSQSPLVPGSRGGCRVRGPGGSSKEGITDVTRTVSVTRRRFLAALSCLGSIGFTPLGAWLRPLGGWLGPPSSSLEPRTSGDVAILASKLARFHFDEASAKVVGLEYLRVASSEASVEILVDLISPGDARRRTELAQADEQKLRRILRAQQRQDFEQGRIANVGGWLLSETECRLCALAALLS